MLALSPRQRILATLVLAGGALASVATSQVYWEIVSESSSVELVTLSRESPEVGYRIDIDFTGAATEPEGYLTVDLQSAVTAPPDGPVDLHAELIDVQSGEVIGSQTVTLTSTSFVSVYFEYPVWMSCTSACSEQYELWIDRLGDALVPVTIDGRVTVSVSERGKDGEPPAGTTVSATVERIELVP